jgi:putative oxidoreductase
MDVSGTVDQMKFAGVPSPNILIWAAVAAEIVGGLSILVGWYARLGALILLVFLGAATYYFPTFWKFEGETQKPVMLDFMKNAALMGAMLLVLAHGAGPMSVDACCEPGTART